jgi:integrase
MLFGRGKTQEESHEKKESGYSQLGTVIAYAEHKRIHREKAGAGAGTPVQVRKPPAAVQPRCHFTILREVGRGCGMTGLSEIIFQVKQQQQENINDMQIFIARNYPNTIKALHIIDRENLMPKRRKGFNLVKVENKKHGFLYYARFSNNGKILPTKFNTHTNDLETAEKYARENKERLVEGYLQRQNGQMYKTLESFYKADTVVNDIYSRRLCNHTRVEYYENIIYKFIPFLKREKINCFEQITTKTLHKFQDYLLSTKIKPQTVNKYFKPLKRTFANLARKEVIKGNPCVGLKGIPVQQGDKKDRGCHNVDKMKGVFNRRWKDNISYLMIMLIYTTGMRNGEILRLRKEDIVNIDGCRFISIGESKTPSGARLVPLHDFVYRKLCARNVPAGAPLFNFKGRVPFNKANAELARQLGVSNEELERENITFYSGRHFFKTLMSSEGLGEDIEEVFMGHKVSSNVAKLYNHRDKQGKKMMVKKAEQVFTILDRCIFKAKP